MGFDDAVRVFERAKPALLAVDAASVAVFLATMDSLSSPCGLGSEYYYDNVLQVIDVIGSYFRGFLLLASMWAVWQDGKGAAPRDSTTPGTAIRQDGKKDGKITWTSGIAIIYCIAAVAVTVFSLWSSLFSNDLDCPNRDHPMGCKTLEYWMVPRNYCSAQLRMQDQGCVVTEESRVKMQMCVRLGRAPLVNGAFAAWLCRTLLVDTIRLVIMLMVASAPADKVKRPDASDDRVAGVLTESNNRRTTVLRPASTRLHERDTLLVDVPHDGVIRQSPHVRKRTAASGFRIDF